MTDHFQTVSRCGATLVRPAASQMSSPLKLTHNGLPEGVNPLSLPDMLEPLRGQLNLRDEDISYVRLLLRKVRRSDFEAGSICAVWDRVTSLSDQLGFSPRRINNIERRLVAARIITKTVTGKHNRFGRRNTAGRIELAAGVNFAPLINRSADLNACFAAQQLQADQLKQSRQHAAELISQIRSLGADEALDTARAALPRLRPSEVKDLRRLDVIIVALTAVLDDFCEGPGRKIETAQSEDLDRPYTKTNINTKTCTKAENKECVNQPMRTTPQQVLLLASSTFAQMIEFYQDGMAPNGTLTWEIISHAARELAQSHGITGADWANNAAQLGQARSALCILLADRNAMRTDHYKVRNVPAAFLGMVRKEAQGKAIIEALVAELTRL